MLFFNGGISGKSEGGIVVFLLHAVIIKENRIFRVFFNYPGEKSQLRRHILRIRKKIIPISR